MAESRESLMVWGMELIKRLGNLQTEPNEAGRM